jgi:hypothetical protein
VKGGVEGGGQAPLFHPRAERSCGLGHLSWLGEFPCGLAADVNSGFCQLPCRFI